MAEKQKKKGGKEIIIGGISHSDMLIFTKHLAVALQSGLTLYEGLDMVGSQAKGRLKQVIDSILEIIQSGRPLHQALERYPKYFSQIYISMVKTGEMAGTLEENLYHLADQLTKSHDLKQKVKGAMMYPMLIFIAITALGLTVATFILPKILPLFETLNVELPITTRMLIWISKLFNDHGITIIIGTIFFTFFFRWFLKRDFIKPFTHRLILKIPVVGKIIRNVNLERFTRTLGTLLGSGITLDDGMKILAESTDNRAYRKAIEDSIPEVVKGNQLSLTLATHPKLFPELTTRMMSMGEHTGSLETTLKYLNEFYEKEVDGTMKNLSTLLEPALLIVIGVVVAVVAISILGPIYKITGGVN